MAGERLALPITQSVLALASQLSDRLRAKIMKFAQVSGSAAKFGQTTAHPALIASITEIAEVSGQTFGYA